MLTSLFKVDRLKPIRSLSRLKVLYMAHNFVRDWREFEHLVELPCLEDLVTIYFFSPVMPSSWIFSLCQDRLSGDAFELGAALLCSSRAGSVYVAVIQKLDSTPGLG